MKPVFTALMLSAVAVVAVAGSREGIAPRPAPADYAVQKQAGNLTVGAARLSNEQLKNSFSSDLARGFVVVEVGIFPGKEAVDVRRGDFLLRASMKNGADMVRPASPETVAGVLQKKNRQAAKSGGIDVYPHGGVGYSTGGTRTATAIRAAGTPKQALAWAWAIRRPARCRPAPTQTAAPWKLNCATKCCPKASRTLPSRDISTSRS